MVDIMSMPTIPRMLVMNGVFKKDCKTFDELTYEKFMDAGPDDVIVDAPGVLPKFYTNKATWPTRMTTLCPCCSAKSDRPPITLITSMDRERDGSIRCMHNNLQFNLWSCAAFYIAKFMNNDSKLKLNLVWLYGELEEKQCYGEIDIGIPPWHTSEYGVGVHSRREWIKLNEVLLEKNQQQMRAIATGVSHEVPTLTTSPTADIVGDIPIDSLDA